MARPAISPEKREQMRGEIRSAVIRIIDRLELSPGDVHGYEKITIRDVIEEANISIGTFYKYFKDRADLAQFLWAEPVNRLKSDMQEAFDRESAPSIQIRVLLEHYAAFQRDNLRLFKAAFMFVRPEKNTAPEAIDLKDEMFYTNLRTALEEGQRQGIFGDFDAHDMAQLIWAAIHGSLALPINLDRYKLDSPGVLSAKMIEALLALIAK